MKTNTRKGFTGIEVAAAVVVLGAVLLFGKQAIKFLPFGHNPAAPTVAEVKLDSAKADAAKTGQQFAAATTQEISLVKDQADPAVIAAKKTATRADVALATGLGAFTPEQAQWVQKLVEADAAGFTAALQQKDEQLARTGDKIATLEKTVAAEKEHSGWLENILVFAAGVFVFINYVLPWLEKIFPPLGIFVAALQAVLNPFLAHLKDQAKAQIAAAEAKAQTLYSELGAAVVDMRAKLGGNAPAAIAHLDNNLSPVNIDAVAKAAQDAAAAQAAAQAKAAAAVQIAATS